MSEAWKQVWRCFLTPLRHLHTQCTLRIYFLTYPTTCPTDLVHTQKTWFGSLKSCYVLGTSQWHVDRGIDTSTGNDSHQEFYKHLHPNTEYHVNLSLGFLVLSPLPCWNMYPNKGGGKDTIWENRQNFLRASREKHYKVSFPPPVQTCTLTGGGGLGTPVMSATIIRG